MTSLVNLGRKFNLSLSDYIIRATSQLSFELSQYEYYLSIMLTISAERFGLIKIWRFLHTATLNFFLVFFLVLQQKCIIIFYIYPNSLILKYYK